MTRRVPPIRLAALTLAAIALFLVTAASGAPGDTYTASAAPAIVKPATSRTYTVQLRNEASSPNRAQRARVGIAAGFLVSGVTATTSTAGTCVAATWIADGTLIADGRINLKRPGGGPPNELCPGATLTVSFTALAPASDGTGAWTTELLRSEAFALVGTQPVVKVDGTPPVTTIGSGPGNPTNSRSASIVFAADEAGSTFECRLDGAAFASCSSPMNLSGLADGGHTFRIRATDAAGNVETSPALHTWTVDVTPPDTTIVSGPPSATSSDFASLAFSATEAGSTFECALDAAAFTPCTSPASYSDVSEGAHVFRARATDQAGNTDASPVVHNWTVDVTAPQTTILGGPANPTNTPTAGFTFSANEGGASFDCRLDGAAFAACVSPATYPGLGDGVHVFDVRARDAAGNTDATPASYTWTIDTNAPEAMIETAPFDPSNVASATFSFSANEAGSAFQCRLDGEPFVQCTSPQPYASLPDGSHTFEVRAVDTAGNTGAPATHRWSIETVAPVTTIASKPDDPTASPSATFTFSTDAAGATFECALDGSAYEPCASPQIYSGLDDGEHRFLVRATQPGNSPGSAAGYAWRVDTVAPTVAIDAAPPVLTNATTAGFAFSSSELSATFLCQFDGGGFAACTSPKGYSALAHGEHTFAVRAVDSAGNQSSIGSHTWSVDLVAPQTTVDTGPPARSGDTSATFAFTSSEPGSTFQCRLDSGSFLPCVAPKTYVSLPDGPHVFEVRATDTVGNTDATPSVREWTVDTTPPETTIDAAPPDPAKSRNASFAFSSSEPGSTFDCRLNGGSFVPCSSPAPFSDLGEGSHTFEVRARDDVGNTDPSAAVYIWTVDTTPPDTTILSHPANPTSSGSPAFTFTASEPGSTFECKLDASPFAACSAPAMYSGLTQGPHTFQVRATDKAGNTDPTSALFAWTIDTTPPDTSITVEPPSPTKSRDASFQFGATEPGSSFECSLDGAAFGGCSSPVQHLGLAEGTHTFDVRATDPAGNTDATPATRTWRIDLTAPQTTIGASPNNPTNSTSATIGFSANENSTFECSLDAAAFVACTTPATYSSLGDGPHTFRVRASDLAGNVDATPAQRSWTVDTAAPSTTIDSGPAAPTKQQVASFAFSSNEPGSSFECKLDGAAFIACTSPASYTNLAEGAHTFQVRATDPAGNQDGSPAARTWTIDLTPPQTTILGGPPSVTNATSASLTFSATEGGSTFECRLDSAAFAPCTSPVDFSNLLEGPHTFRVRATDPVGNTDATAAVRAWTIDLTAPQTTIDVAPADPINDSSPSFSFSASESGSTFECSLDGGPFTACTSPAAYGQLVEGRHTFQVKATDLVGNIDASAAERSWTIDLTAPQTVIGTAPASLVNSASAAFGFSAGETGSTFQCSLDGAAFAACSSPQGYSALAEGQHTFRVRAIDPAGNADASPADHVWTIDLTAPQTTIDETPANPTNDRAASFKFSASESGATFECKLDGAAFASCSSPKSYADLPDGSHSFSVRATDPAANVDGTPSAFTWTVDVTGPQTTIDSRPLDPTSSLSASFSFSASEPGSTFECRLDDASFSACTSPKSYAGLGEGPHTFRVRSTDPTGNTDGSPAAYTWSIDVTPPQTTILSSPSTPTNDPTPSFGFSSTEPGSTFECKLDAGAFAACTSPKAYLALADGAHTFQVRARDAAGNSDPTPDSRSWTIDTVFPETTLTSSPLDRTTSLGATFTFSASDPGSSFECRLDAASFAACSSPISYTSLTEGAHTFRVRATDPAGNVDGTAAVRTWTIDLTAPRTTIVTAPADPTNDRNPTFTFSSDEVGGTFSCRLDGGTFASCTSPKTYVGLDESSHTFEVRATDVVGNVDASPDARTWRIDITAPQTTLGSGPPDPTNTTTASITFSANEPGSTFACRLDGIGAFLSCTSPAVFNDLGDGPHTFHVRATDPAGNTDASPAVHTWTVETGAPTTTITSAPPLAVASTSASFGLAADEPVARFECSLDAEAFAPCVSPKTYHGLAQGSHTFRARAIDLAGNVGTPTTRTWTVDTVAPDTGITSGPPETVDNGSATFTFAATEAAARFECALDGAAFSGCVSPLTLNDLPDGSHTLQVRAWDVVGNVDSTPAAHAWTVARPSPPAPDIPPAAPDRTAPAEVANLRVAAGDGSVAITWRLPGDADLDHVTVTRITPGKTVRTAVVYYAAGAGVTDRGLKNGLRYRYRITTHDRAGNASAGVEAAASPQAVLYAPARGATLTAAPTLRWKAAPKAFYYNVQLWRVSTGAQAAAARPVKVLSAWPAKARLRLSGSWKFEGRKFTLLPGRYRWYVWPGLGKRAAQRYGPMLGESSFTVKAKKR